MSNLPRKTGYYWAKWKIAADGTLEGDELTPSSTWEIVQVNDNHPSEDNIDAPEKFSVSVSGVRETQWPDGFFWGDYVAELNAPAKEEARIAKEAKSMKVLRAMNRVAGEQG